MPECSRSLKAVGLDVVLCTSDITCYDGAQFACITIPTNANLNQVLAALGNKICDVAASIAAPVNASAVVYSGTTVFPCFTLVGGNVQDIIQSLATQVCTLASTIPADAGGLQRGAGIVYAGGVTPGAPTDPIDTLFNDIMTRMGVMTTDITGLANVDDIAAVVSTYFRGSDFVFSGAVDTPSGLNVTIDDGAAGDSIYGINGYKVTVPSTVKALTALADNYLDVDEDGVYTVTPVAVAAPAPPIPSNSMRLYMFTTNALNVIATTDFRNIYPINSNTLLGDGILATRNYADLSVTGAKMETIGAAATVGDAGFFEISYDIKGRVTAASANYSFAGLAAGNLMRYDGAAWTNWVPNYIDGSGTAGRVSRFTDADTIADSIIRDDGTTVGINVAVSASRQLYVNATAVGISTSGYFSVSGANATNIGIIGTSSNATNVDAGIIGVGGAALSFPKATGIAGVVGTGYTAGVKEAYGGVFAVDTDGAATGDSFGVYIVGNNSGAGRSYSIVAESGKALIGAAASTLDCAIFEVVSTTQGVLVPRMTTAEKNAIAAPTGGLIVYDTTLNKLCVYTAAAWETITSV